ncbi:transmembrane emp24 domain-containing protein 1 isoform X1 [Fukomys damarensis]|uniref:transmembrane emp24 domain-containing protein 1 isoform X1 n=1 Tax=Fukomys damarensis TaxID=885580 RepID=UPI00054035E6|nr:transmembrane emp24 domain-containing protein 1 isoform X1 [Fukomys damarensis]
MAAGVALALALWLLLPPVGVGVGGPPPIQDGEFTFLLPAGRKQCFYQSAPANASLEAEYQVEGSRAAELARAKGRERACSTAGGGRSHCVTRGRSSGRAGSDRAGLVGQEGLAVVKAGPEGRSLGAGPPEVKEPLREQDSQVGCGQNCRLKEGRSPQEIAEVGLKEKRRLGVPFGAVSSKGDQVIGGAGLDVDFTLESPQGVLLVSEARKADGVHTVEPTEAGDYRLCFDNSFSTISEKLVFFELIFDSLQDDEEVEGWAEAVEPEEMLDVKMEDIKESMETMRTRLERSIQVLTLLRALEARDRNLQEGNLERVNFWSAVNVAALLLVAVLQVCTLKRFFQDKHPVPT